MKLVGIINEHSPELSSKKYEDFKLDCNYENIEKILDYLEKGVPVAVTMHLGFSLIKEDSSIIGGIIYYTDGFGFGLIILVIISKMFLLNYLQIL